MNKFLFFSNLFFVALSVKTTAQVGTNDASFDPGTGAGAIVLTTSTQTDGKVIVGGAFTAFNGAAKYRIARLNSDGSLDATFNSGTGCGNTVYKVGVLASGKTIACGQFISYAGASANRIVRLNTNGTKDATFTSGTAANDFIYFFVEQPDAKLLICGGFSTYNGTARSRIARLNANGTIDATFVPSGTAFNKEAYTMALQADGKIIAGGLFTHYNSIASSGIIRLNSDGTRDAGFAVGTGITGTSAAVYCVIVQPDEKVLVGGTFTAYNGTTKNNLFRLNNDGTLDAAFNPGGTGPNGYVKQLSLQPDGKIIAVGAFTTYNGVSKPRIVRLNSDGTVDNAFNGTGGNNNINSVELLSTNDLMIGGDFTTYSGVSRTRIARVHNACPTLTVSLAGQRNNLCYGTAAGSASVTALGGTTFTYTWLPSGGNASTTSGLPAGTYTCIVNNECFNSTSVTVTITQPTPVSLSVGAASTVCPGNNASLTSSASGGTGVFTYEWLPGNLAGQNQTVNPVSNTVYTVLATDANGCTTTTTQNVDVYTSSINISGGATAICGGSTVALTASGVTTYTWSTGDNTATTQVSPASTTTYSVSGTDANGCMNTSSKTVTVTGVCATASVPCGILINNLALTANASSVTGAVSYRFKFYNNTTNALIGSRVQSSRTFTFNTITGLFYGNTYKWTVAVDKGTGFGPESSLGCTVTFPPAQTTVPCGTNYSNLNSYTTAQYLANALNYRFTFYNNATNALVAVKTQTSNYIYFNQVPGLVYGNIYKWTVEVQYNNGSTTLYGPASSSLCTVSFSPPQTTVPCGNTYAQNAYTAVSYVTGANAYRYNFYDAVTNSLVATITNTNTYIYFNQVPGLIFNKRYNWTVEVRYNDGSGNVFGPASASSCIMNYGTPSSLVINGDDVITEETSAARIAQQLQATNPGEQLWINLYPNPAREDVKIEASENIKEVRIYNISGELVLAPEHIETIDLKNLKTGIYTVSIQTETALKHLKLIKE